MANKKSGENKAQFIRDVLAENPKADFKTVEARGKERGLTISYSHYYITRAKAGVAKRRAKRERAIAASGSMNVRSPIELLRKVKGLADEVGGMKNLLQIVTLLSE